MFSNIALSNIISGNLTAFISDHLPEFLVAPNTFSNAFHPSKVGKMSTRNFWELSGKK